MTDNVLTYLRQAGLKEPKATFAETLASLLKEPKLYLMRTLVNNVPLETILDLVGKTIDIQSTGGMLLSEAGFELKQSNFAETNLTLETMAQALPDESEQNEKRKKTAGGVFLALIKKDPRITKEMLRKILKAENERRRQRKFTASLIMGLDISTNNGTSSEESKKT